MRRLGIVFEEVLRGNKTKRDFQSEIYECEREIAECERGISAAERDLATPIGADPTIRGYEAEARSDTREQLRNYHRRLDEAEIKLDDLYTKIQLWENPFYKEDLERHDETEESARVIRQREDNQRRIQREREESLKREIEEKKKNIATRRKKTLQAVIVILVVILSIAIIGVFATHMSRSIVFTLPRWYGGPLLTFLSQEGMVHVMVMFFRPFLVMTIPLSIVLASLTAIKGERSTGYTLLLVVAVVYTFNVVRVLFNHPASFFIAVPIIIAAVISLIPSSIIYHKIVAPLFSKLYWKHR